MPGSQTLTSRDLGHIVLSTTFSTEDRAGVLPSIEKSPLGMGTTTTKKKKPSLPRDRILAPGAHLHGTPQCPAFGEPNSILDSHKDKACSSITANPRPLDRRENVCLN